MLRRPIFVPPSGLGAVGAAGQGGSEDIETDPVRSGQATPLDPPLLSSPVDLSANINFTLRRYSHSRARPVRTSFSLKYRLTVPLESSSSRLLVLFRLRPRAQPYNADDYRTRIHICEWKRSGSGRPNSYEGPDVAAFVNRTSGARPTLLEVRARNSQDRPVRYIGLPDGTMIPTAFRWIYSAPHGASRRTELPPPPPDSGSTPEIH